MCPPGSLRKVEMFSQTFCVLLLLVLFGEQSPRFEMMMNSLETIMTKKKKVDMMMTTTMASIVLVVSMTIKVTFRQRVNERVSQSNHRGPLHHH